MIGGVISLWTIGLLAQSSPPVSSRETQATPTFEKDILAIVENHCQQCHPASSDWAVLVLGLP